MTKKQGKLVRFSLPSGCVFHPGSKNVARSEKRKEETFVKKTETHQNIEIVSYA
jgi:hypothetical protein